MEIISDIDDETEKMKLSEKMQAGIHTMVESPESIRVRPEASDAAFRSGGQVSAETGTCRAPTAALCFQDSVCLQIWNHSVLGEKTFTTGCEASLNALDLAFELGTHESAERDRVHVPRVRPLRSKARFQQNVELFVGCEFGIYMNYWPHILGVSIFHHENFEDSDEITLMANNEEQHVPVQARQEPVPLMDNPHAVQQEEDPFINVNVEVPEDSDQESWSPIAYATSSWKTTLIIALDRQASSLSLDWNDYGGMHASIARELDVAPADPFHVHHVRHARSIPSLL